MDQDAFRNLLSAPRNDAGPSRVHRKGGAAPPKRGWGLKQTKEHKKPYGEDVEKEKKVEHIAPRHAQKKQGTEGVYKDRAELRRAGKDDEYKDVEKMLADFEKRKAEAEDAETVEKTRQFLGGDATHSVLVKGLDYSLLAQRKAELEREREVGREEELEALMDDIPTKAGPSAPLKKADTATEAEKLGKGFKTIGKGADGEKKKKKKKKSETGSKVKEEEDIKPTLPEPAKPSIPIASTSKSAAKSFLPPPEDDEEDIFGDAGEYDLGGGALSDDDSDEDSDNEPVVKASPRGRSTSREKDDRYRNERSYSRSRSRERGEVPERNYRRDDFRDRYDRRERSESRERYRQDRQGYSRRPYSRSRSRSRSRDPPRQRYRSPSRSPPRQYDSRRRSRSPPRRYRSRSRSRPPYSDKRRRVDSPSRSPPRRRRSPSPYRRGHYRSPDRRPRSPTPPPAKRTRRPTRSPSPFNFGGPPMSRSPSLSRSPSPVLGGKLQPLQSSTITDLSGFLAAESAGAKNDEKKLKKAQWRSRQGLGVQEGVDPSSLKREMNDKQKSNREYILLMNKLKKDEEAGEKGKDK